MYEVSQNMSKEHVEFLKKVKRKETAIKITQLSILIAFFALWEIAGRLKLIDPFLFSQPSRMIKTIINLSEDGSLFTHIWVTLSETLIGFALGTVSGIVIAILLW